MKVVVDVEANGLENPTLIHVIVTKDVNTGEIRIFRNVTTDTAEKRRFLDHAREISHWIGHNLLGYDYPVLHNLLGILIPDPGNSVTDTLILSKIVNYSRSEGHSIESYSPMIGLTKVKDVNFAVYSKELEERCIRDVETCKYIYDHYSGIALDLRWRRAIHTEQCFQLIVNNLHTNGFSFNRNGAERLLGNVQTDLEVIDKEMQDAFPPREVLIREFSPRLTKHGTISRTSVPRALHRDIHKYSAGNTYRYTKQEAFNPDSIPQIIAVLNEAKWKPTDKTKTHIEVERELNLLKREKIRSPELDLKVQACENKILKLRKFGWKINEANLDTLPLDAPAPARLLARRILLESRRRTLTEWLGLCRDDGRIHGKFYGIGAWTHRMAHQEPNTANIPTGDKLFGKEMRSLWQAPKNRLLVGVDAEGIQLRIFAHYIDDAEFTRSLVEGRKNARTDPHSLNARVLGSVCSGRQIAKRFIYAYLLGAGLGKLAEVLGASKSDTEEALARLLRRYHGLSVLKQEVIPEDARRGSFRGLDGRMVPIPGDTVSKRKHLCMSGYLQNGEAVAMKMACILWHEMLVKEFGDVADLERYLRYRFFGVSASLSNLVRLFLLVNFVHDEWQTETKNDMAIATKVAKIQADSLRLVGEELNLKCPLAGSYWSDDHNDYSIGTNWSVTH